MAFARDVYTASGGQTDFTITFAYRDNDDIVVSQNGTTLTETTDYTFPNATTMRLNSGATASDTIVLQRATSQSTLLVDFQAGTLTSDDLDDSAQQLFYMAQEAIDISNVALGLDASEEWDAESRPINNVTDPTDDQDAATKNYVDQTALGSLTTPLSIANGGTSGATAAAARTALGLEIGTDIPGLSTTNTFTALPTFQNDTGILAESQDAGAAAGPVIEMYRNTASAANNDIYGQLKWTGQNDAPEKVTYADITMTALGVVDGGEWGRLDFSTLFGGSYAQRCFVLAGFYMLGATGGDKGAGTINATAVYDDGVQITPLVEDTAIATTSGTSADFTGIPAGTKRITISFDQVSLSGTDELLVQIGDSGGLETTGYTSTSGVSIGAGGNSGVTSTSGFIMRAGTAGNAYTGHMTLTKINDSTDTWISSHNGMVLAGTNWQNGGGVKSLSAELDRVSLVASGSDTFDAGQVNIMYE